VKDKHWGFCKEIGKDNGVDMERQETETQAEIRDAENKAIVSAARDGDVILFARSD
jgi:hypothetical protein